MVPTDEAMITRQMLYPGLLVPATAAFAITSSIYRSNLSCTQIRAPDCLRLFLPQTCAHRQLRSGEHSQLPLPLSKARDRKNDHMRPCRQFDFRWRAAHVLAVERDFRARRRGAEIALYFLHFLGSYGLHRAN